MVQIFQLQNKNPGSQNKIQSVFLSVQRNILKENTFKAYQNKSTCYCEANMYIFNLN